jgi:Tfp pilus assembly protein PilF
MGTEHRDAFYGRGLALRSNGRPDLAAREFEQAIGVDPNHAYSYAMLALCRSDVGVKGADDASRRAVELAPADSFVHYVRGWVLLGLSRRKDALVHAKEALRLHATTAENFVLLAEIHLRGAKPKDALPVVEEALRLDPSSVRAHRQRAMALRALNRPDEAREAAEKALSLEPNEARNHLAAGFVAAGRRDGKAAALAFREALRLDPTSAAARQGLVIAMKVKNPVFRWATAPARPLAWILARIPRTVRVVVLAVFAVACMATGNWTVLLIYFLVLAPAILADAVANLVLRCDRYGRELLSPAQTVYAESFAALLLCGAGIGATLPAGAPAPVVATAAFVGLAAPAALRVRNCRPGGGTKWMAAYATTFLVAGVVCPWLMALGFAEKKSPDTAAAFELAGLGAGVYAGLAFAFGGFVARRCGYPWSHRFDARSR